MPGRNAARLAVASWFAPPNVAGLNTVYTAEPKNVPATDYFAGQPAGTASGAIAFPHIEQQHKTRETMGPVGSAWLIRVYRVGLVVRFLSRQRRSQDAVADHDTLMDAIEARLEHDPTLGGAFFEAGEGDLGIPQDIEIITDLPKQLTKGGGTVIWSVVQFNAVEFAQPA